MPPVHTRMCCRQRERARVGWTEAQKGRRCVMRCEMLHSVIRHGVHGPKRNARAAPRGDVFLDEWPPPEPARPLMDNTSRHNTSRHNTSSTQGTAVCMQMCMDQSRCDGYAPMLRRLAAYLPLQAADQRKYGNPTPLFASSGPPLCATLESHCALHGALPGSPLTCVWCGRQ